MIRGKSLGDLVTVGWVTLRGLGSLAVDPGKERFRKSRYVGDR